MIETMKKFPLHITNYFIFCRLEDHVLAPESVKSRGKYRLTVIAAVFWSISIRAGSATQLKQIQYHTIHGSPSLSSEALPALVLMI